MYKAKKSVTVRLTPEVWEHLEKEKSYTDTIEKALRQYYGMSGVEEGEEEEARSQYPKESVIGLSEEVEDAIADSVRLEVEKEIRPFARDVDGIIGSFDERISTMNTVMHNRISEARDFLVESQSKFNKDTEEAIESLIEERLEAYTLSYNSVLQSLYSRIEALEQKKASETGEESEVSVPPEREKTVNTKTEALSYQDLELLGLNKSTLASKISRAKKDSDWDSTIELKGYHLRVNGEGTARTFTILEKPPGA